MVYFGLLFTVVCGCGCLLWPMGVFVYCGLGVWLSTMAYVCSCLLWFVGVVIHRGLWVWLSTVAYGCDYPPWPVDVVIHHGLWMWLSTMAYGCGCPPWPMGVVVCYGVWVWLSTVAYGCGCLLWCVGVVVYRGLWLPDPYPSSSRNRPTSCTSHFWRLVPRNSTNVEQAFITMASEIKQNLGPQDNQKKATIDIDKPESTKNVKQSSGCC